MNKLLTMTQERRRLIFEQTAIKMNLADVGVEKDFWVCWTLDKLFGLPCSQHLTFKGGTSLSKGWQLIERFSEDIDITIHREALGFGGEMAPHAAPSKKQQKKRLNDLKAECERYVGETLQTELAMVIAQTLPDDQSWSLEIDPEDSQSLLFGYQTVLPYPADYLLPWVKIELGGRADVEPSDLVTIRPYVAEAFPEVFPGASVNVRAILPVRTFWEKAMLLHEESFRPAEKKRKKSMARHYYDLYRMIDAGVAESALADLELFHDIAAQRQHYFQYTWVDYSTHKPGSLRVVPNPEQLADWETDYSNMKREMFFGEVPEFGEVLKRVQKFQENFNKIKK